MLYPPPWKITSSKESLFPPEEGAPEEFVPGDLDADFFQMPYGLFTLAAEVISRGHQVKVLNLSSYSWEEVERIISELRADLYGMSCWTANRRGVAYTAALIRELYPKSHITIGGPHATPFAREMLDHYPAIDTVCVGESEPAFLELVERLGSGESTQGITGTFFRGADGIESGGKRASVRNLDELTPPQTYFATHILMTSRGCPWQCTFCGAETTWGRGFRGHSVEYVVDAMELSLAKLPVRMIQIKDDTFTANQKRALEICCEIRRRKLSFLWSCDTRVDVLSEELLKEMRLAGCERLSLGVESGSDTILRNIDKKITAEEITQAAEMAKAVGISVRFYMMLGNRGETQETFAETLSFLERTKPHQYVFSCLSIYPGTRDFDQAVAEGWLDPGIYFQAPFQELKTPFDADEATTRALSAWFEDHRGIQRYYQCTLAEALSILAKVGDYHAAHMDLAGAYFREGILDKCEEHARRALELGTPVPGLALNYLAVSAYRKGDLQGMQDHFLQAAKTDPQHMVLIQNVERTRTWFRDRGPELGLPLELNCSHDFQLLERTLQPTLPGPLPQDFWDFGTSPAAVPRHMPSLLEVTPEGHEKQSFPARSLRVISS